MFLEDLTVLRCLSVTATVSTIALFLCGLPICINVWRRKSTKDISAAPFLMGLLGGSYWLRYGFVKEDIAMVTVNLTAVTLMSAYLAFFFIYTSPKYCLGISISIVLFLISLMVYLVATFEVAVVIDPLGIACMTFNIINFGAPLAGLKVVIRQHCCETLPLPLCIANFLVSSQWCLYGVLKSDIYIIIPNAIGVSLAMSQLSLFFIFPLKQGQESILGKICRNQIDAEKGEAQPKKSWVPDHITSGDLTEFDPTHIRLEKKRFSCLPVIDSISLDGSETTETTEFSQSQCSSLSKDSECEKLPDLNHDAEHKMENVILYVSGL